MYKFKDEKSRVQRKICYDLIETAYDEVLNCKKLNGEEKYLINLFQENLARLTEKIRHRP